jgi:hypothetical protein
MEKKNGSAERGLFRGYMRISMMNTRTLEYSFPLPYQNTNPSY